MARSNTAKELVDGSVLTQNLEYNRIVPRTLEPDLQRHLKEQTDPPKGTRMTKRPREGFPRADEQEDSIRLEELLQGDTEDSIQSTTAMKRNMVKEPFSKDLLGKSIRVSTNLYLLWELFFPEYKVDQFPRQRVETIFCRLRLWMRMTRRHCLHGIGS